MALTITAKHTGTCQFVIRVQQHNSVHLSYACSDTPTYRCTHRALRATDLGVDLLQIPWRPVVVCLLTKQSRGDNVGGGTGSLNTQTPLTALQAIKCNSGLTWHPFSCTQHWAEGLEGWCNTSGYLQIHTDAGIKCTKRADIFPTNSCWAL